jgi:UDP-glucuronate 4-epimerase
MSDECFLVTGSGGCIGSWTVRRLVERGERCIALDVAPERARLRRILDDDRLHEVKLVRGDVLEDGFLSRLIEEQEVTRVVHLAALQIPFVAADPVRGATVNVVGTVRVLEAARHAGGRIRGLAYASSAAVYDASGRELRPATLYGVFKVTNEETARMFWQDHGLPSIGLRPWAVFGPGRDQGLTAAPTHAMKAAALGVPYHIPFGGRLDLQYAPDVAEAFIGAALAEIRGAVVYNLRGNVVGVDEIVSAIEDVRPDARGLVTHGDEAIPIAPELADGGFGRLVGDVPRTELRVAVRETIEHFAALADAGLLGAAELQAT